MFKVNEDLSIYVNRGDIASIHVTATKDDAVHTFKAGDILRIKVVEKKNCEKVVLQKDVDVQMDSEVAVIELTEKDTRIGHTISKPVDYWYEIELNPFDNPQTIIGYDEDGAKVFRLFPEAKDLEDDDIEEEDIPVVDPTLDATSHRPVENQAIAREFASVKNDIVKNASAINVNATATKKNESNLNSHVENHNNPHKVTAEQVGARPNTWMPTAQEVGARSNTWMPTASDVGARPDTWMPTASQVGARPNTWMPTAQEVGATPEIHATDMGNPHNVTASQVGARPDTWMPTAEEVGARPNTWTPTAEEVGALPSDWMPTASDVGAVTEAQVTTMINDALGVIENAAY